MFARLARFIRLSECRDPSRRRINKAFGSSSRGGRAAALPTLFFAAIATAQPVPNADLGELASPSTTTGTLTGFLPGQVQWIRFRLPAPATLAGDGYLDIDTNGGTLTGGDSHIGLYRADGTFLNSNDDSGPGLYSMLSYGRMNPTRPGVVQLGNATTIGSVHTGSAGAEVIAAGTYFLAVTGFGGNTYAANFVVGTTHSRTGDVAFRMDYVGNPPSIPPRCVLGVAPTSGSAGSSFIATATVTPGTAPVSTGLAVRLSATSINGGLVVLLDNGIAPDAVAGDHVFTGTGTVGAGAPLGAQTLTSSVSDLQARISQCATTYTVLAPPPANDECAGAFPAHTGDNAYDTNDATTSTPASPCGLFGTDVWFRWSSGPGGLTTVATCDFTTVDTVIAVYANCGSANALRCSDDSCGLQSSLTFCAVPSNTYFIRIGDFAGGNPHTGAFSIVVAGPCPGCHGSCVADFDDGSASGVPDGGVTIDDILFYLALFEAGTSCADVDDGSGAGTPGGGITIDDLLYYLLRYEAGC